MSNLIRVFIVLFFHNSLVLRAKVVDVPIDKPLPSPSHPDDLAFLYEQQIYIVRVIKVYRGFQKVQKSFGNYTKRRHVKLYAPARLNSCSIELRKNKIYLLGGWVADEKLQVGGCSLLRFWSDMSPSEKLNLKRYYIGNCGCRIDTCFDKQGCQGNDTMTCKWDMSYLDFNYKVKCTPMHQYCRKSYATQACEWHDTRQYKKCRNNVIP